ncbi:MAG TPA: beta-ketoacyl synthase N-terminal-like domain-containing protein, partial [Thermoanaerobaculia bacterium]
SPELTRDPRHVPAAGVLEGADRFDARLFGLTPREAALLDPQHRQFLECAWEALEDAGRDPARPGGAVGVFGGASLNTYLLESLLPSGERVRTDPQVAISNDKDFLTTRVSYKLDLRGPSLDVQTACSTSLVAVVLACQSLLSFQCDLALAGGVSVREPQKAGYLFQEGGILSPDGRCRPFDAAARGTVPGNGVGVVVLKRLEDALVDGDRIRAVIRGAALNNDGAAKVGYTAPGVDGQAEVIALAQAVAGVRPSDVTFVEAHGTATPLGDPIEVRALHRVFREDGAAPASCALGAIKSNLGHLDAAAGIAGFIKAVLALEHREIPPTLHFERPNPALELDGGPFYVNAAPVPWRTDRLPRRAGVSSFGIGGTNAHVVLEEAPARPAPPPAERAPELLLLSAHTPAALEAASTRLAAHLRSQPDLDLSDVAFTLRLGRRQLSLRRALVARDATEAAAALEEASPERVWTAEAPDEARRVAFLFPGQGAQEAGMAAALYAREPVFRAEVDACCELLAGQGLPGLRDLLAAPADDRAAAARLAATETAQPALFTVEYALARLWMSWGVRPAALLGHSLGEYVAACLAGVMSLPDALALVAERGRLAAKLPPGAMLSVSLGEAELAGLLPDGVELAALAAVNAPDRAVAAGRPEAIDRLAEILAGRGVEHRRLPVGHAFHTADVEAVREELAAAVGRLRLAPPEIPYLSNVTGTWADAGRATDPAAWAEHLRRPVRFAAGVAALLADPGLLLLEVGPGQTLTSLARRHPAAAGRTVLPSLPARGAWTPADAFLPGTLGRLWLAGAEIDWAAVHPGRGRRVALPSYPFERVRHWIEPAAAPAPPAEASATIAAALWRQTPPLPAPSPGQLNGVWLVLAGASALSARLSQRLHAERLEVLSAAAGGGFSQVGESAFTVDPARPEDLGRLLDALPPDRPVRVVALWELDGLRPLTAALRERRVPVARLDVVTEGRGLPGSSSATLQGLCEELAVGEPTWTVQWLDLEPADPGTRAERLALDRLWAELAAPISEGEAGAVAWRGGARWQQAWEELSKLIDPTDRTDPSDRSDLSATTARLEAELESSLPSAGEPDLDPLCAAHLVRFLGECGVEMAPGTALPLTALRRKIRLLPKYERLFQAVLRMLAEDGLLAVEDGEVRLLRAADGDPESLGRRIVAAAPRLAGLVELIDHCLRGYRRALSGEIEGLALLYPDGRPEMLQRAMRLLGEREPSDPAGAVLGEILGTALAGPPPGGGPWRILEVGAGQGVLTRELLPLLLEGRELEYWFTDLGRTFVLRAEREAAEAGHGFLRFGVLDASRDPGPQGFAPGSFHAVLAANVVHATPRIAETLGHLRSLLAPGGLLALVETVRGRRWSDLVWGLTDGWWLFADTDLRATSPLLAIAAWEGALARAGFTGVEAWPRGPRLRAATDGALLTARRPAAAPATAGLALWIEGEGSPVEEIAVAPGTELLVLGSTRPGSGPALAARAAELSERHGLPAVALEAGSREELEAALPCLLRHRGGLPPRLAVRRAAARTAPVTTATTTAEAPAVSGHERPRLRNPFVAPRDGVEREIAAIWSRALGLAEVGVHDNFFDLGGDSLAGLQVMHALKGRFDLGGRAASLFETPTVAALARFLAAAGEGSAAPSPEGGESALADRSARRGALRRELQSARRRREG